MFFAEKDVPGEEGIYERFLPGRLGQVGTIARGDHLHERIYMDHPGLRFDLADRVHAGDRGFAQSQPKLETILPSIFVGRHPAPFAAAEREEGDLVYGREEM